MPEPSSRRCHRVECLSSNPCPHVRRFVGKPPLKLSERNRLGVWGVEARDVARALGHPAACSQHELLAALKRRIETCYECRQRMTDGSGRGECSACALDGALVRRAEGSTGTEPGRDE